MLGKYVRTDSLLTLEDAVRKMTSATAARLKLRDRGLLREGMYADVTVFDPATIIDKATFEKPHQLSVGVKYVFVNGVAVVSDGKHTGAKPGRAVRGQVGVTTPGGVITLVRKRSSRENSLKLNDYYEVLQVSPRADRDTIERVFRYLANRFHPDNRETGDGDRFTEIADAYATLSSAEKRARYDLSYERVRESRWKLFSRETTTDDVAADTRIRLALMSILYIVRRNNPDQPGVGSVELERLLECPEPVIKFHCWYLRENSWIVRLETGHLAISALGVDRLFELGGPASSSDHLIRRGNMHTPRSQRAIPA